MENLIPILIILLVLAGAILYIVRSKKKGKRCIGCPSGCSCGKGCCSSEKTTQNQEESK